MARSFLKLYSLDLGFETGHLLTLRTQLVESKYPKPEQRQIFFDALQARIRALPGVTQRRDGVDAAARREPVSSSSRSKDGRSADAGHASAGVGRRCRPAAISKRSA